MGRRRKRRAVEEARERVTGDGREGKRRKQRPRERRWRGVGIAVNGRGGLGVLDVGDCAVALSLTNQVADPLISDNSPFSFLPGGQAS